MSEDDEEEKAVRFLLYKQKQEKQTKSPPAYNHQYPKEQRNQAVEKVKNDLKKLI